MVPSVSEGNTGLKRFFETLWVPLFSARVEDTREQ
jgi:hypothetical protein